MGAAQAVETAGSYFILASFRPGLSLDLPLPLYHNHCMYTPHWHVSLYWPLRGTGRYTVTGISPSKTPFTFRARSRSIARSSTHSPLWPLDIPHYGRGTVSIGAEIARGWVDKINSYQQCEIQRELIASLQVWQGARYSMWRKKDQKDIGEPHGRDTIR